MLHIRVVEAKNLRKAPEVYGYSPAVVFENERSGIFVQTRPVDNMETAVWNQVISIPLTGMTDNCLSIKIIDGNPVRLNDDNLTSSVIFDFRGDICEICEATITLDDATLHVVYQIAPTGHPPFEEAGAAPIRKIYPDLISGLSATPIGFFGGGMESGGGWGSGGGWRSGGWSSSGWGSGGGGSD